LTACRQSNVLSIRGSGGFPCCAIMPANLSLDPDASPAALARRPLAAG
jgi:hypothetical protein